MTCPGDTILIVSKNLCAVIVDSQDTLLKNVTRNMVILRDGSLEVEILAQLIRSKPMHITKFR